MSLIHTSFIKHATCMIFYRPVMVSIMVISMLSCKNKMDSTQEGAGDTMPSNGVTLTEGQLKQVNIQTAPVAKIKMGGIIHLNGKAEVSPQNLVSVSAPMGGYIKTMKWTNGMKVQKGQVIAVMEDKEFIQLQQDYLMTKTGLFYTRKEYERQRELNKTQASSDKILLQSEEALKNKIISLKALEEKLKWININPEQLTEEKVSAQINIYAPISGYISGVRVNTGQYVQPADVILNIVDIRHIYVHLKAFEKDIPFISPGDVAMIYTNNRPDIKYKGQVAYLGKTLSEEGYIEITCTLNELSALLPGMYTIADIEASAGEKMALPEEAIVNYEGKEYVFIAVSNEYFSLHEVSTGVRENGYTEITNYLKITGKNVVINGAYSLLMKMKNVSE